MPFKILHKTLLRPFQLPPNLGRIVHIGSKHVNICAPYIHPPVLAHIPPMPLQTATNISGSKEGMPFQRKHQHSCWRCFACIASNNNFAKRALPAFNQRDLSAAKSQEDFHRSTIGGVVVVWQAEG